MKKAIAVIELGESHEECLPSTIWFLSETYKVDLYINHVLWERTKDLQSYCQNVHTIESKDGVVSITNSLKLARTLQKTPYHRIFLNTAQGRIKFLCLFSWFNRTKFIGLLHNLQKLEKSVGQRLISHKVSQYLVLNDYLQETAQGLTKVPVASYYPIFYPPQPAEAIEKPLDQIWITVPGRVENKRRDYQQLIRAAHLLKNHPRYRLVILGNIQATVDGRALASQILEEGLSRQFITFKEFISVPLFHSYIQASDILLPLTTSRISDFKKYLDYKISGTWNMAFAYKKPMLIHPAFLIYADFTENAVALEDSVEEDQLLQQIETCLNKSCYNELKWRVSLQKKCFLHYFSE